MLWGLVLGFVVHGIIAASLFLSHLGRRPAERLPPLRFGLTLAVAMLLPVLTAVGLRIRLSVLGATEGGAGTLLALLVASSMVGLFFGAIGSVLYAVVSGLATGISTS